MSARNPLAIIKSTVYSSLNRAYYVRKMRDTGEIVEYIHDDVAAALSPKLFAEAVKAWIRDLITSRFERTDCLTEQVDLFRDLDYQFAFRKKKKTVQRALCDLNLEEGEAPAQRKVANLEAAAREKARYDRHWAHIKPLLVDNLGWLWRTGRGRVEAKSRISRALGGSADDAGDDCAGAVAEAWAEARLILSRDDRRVSAPPPPAPPKGGGAVAQTADLGRLPCAT